MTPHHLHALAAAWSLQAARGQLAHLADEEAAQIAAEALEAPALLRSPVWGGRHGSGGHGDPTPGMLAVDDRPERRNRWAEMGDRLRLKLTWLAEQLPTASTDPDPWWRLYDALPRLQPGTAAVLARHLADEDRWIREAIGVGPVRAPVIGVPCPGCERRELYVQVAGPETAWTVVCAAGCRCLGQPDTRLPDAEREPGCPCGMEQRVEGVAHIWPRAAVITGAVAGAASS